MKPTDENITKILTDLEISLNERWSKGDSSGYFDNYHESVNNG